MQEISYKVYLYKPEAAAVTVDNAASYFLGELIVDNLQVDIRLQEISTISFTIPRKINDITNTRIDEVLDSYIIELWYGNLTGTFNQDYFKYRFVIYSTPLSFSDDKFIHSYQGFSLESLLEIKKIVSWPGIEISDYFRKLTYNNNGTTSKFLEAKDTGVGGNFEYTFNTSTNAQAQKYITVTPTLATVTDLDIFIYELRENLIVGQEAETESGMIPLNGAAGISDDGSGVNNNAFKQGYYYLTISGGYVTAVHIALPDTYVNYNGVSTSDKILSFKFYDNPLSRRYAIGLVTNQPQANNMYIDLAHDAALGNATNYDDYNFKTQQFYSKNGLTLKQVLLGKEDTSTATVTEDGLLYNTNFTIDEIDADLLSVYRSNLEFNNVSRYEAIKALAESFDAIAVFNSADNSVSFYPENVYGQNNGLIFRYGAYLKSLQKEIDASKIITNAIGLGKDNLTINLVNPTGFNYWEDYSYYLDDYYIDPSQTTADLISAGFTVSVSGTKGLAITYPAGTYSSRWMNVTQAQKLGAWQYTRDYFHKILLGEVNPSGAFSSYARYYNLYNIRIEAIRELVKKETEYLNLLKKVKKLETFKNYWYRLHLNNPSNATYETKYNNYLGDYTDANTAATNFYNNILVDLENDIYDKTIADSIADKMFEVTEYLEKATAHGIDLDTLRPFQRENVVNDSKIDTEIDLLGIVKTHVDENKEPKITISIDIADILAAEEAKDDWNKVKIGDKVNIYLQEFNVDVIAQIREISVNFQERTLNLTISTVRNYNKGFGNFVLKKIRNLNNSNENNVNYEVDKNRNSNQTSDEVNDILENGLSTTDTDVTSGATDKDENPSTVTNSAGTTIAAIASVDELTETVTFESLSTEGITISDGSILAYKSYTSPTVYTSQVEMSADTGFTIRKIDSVGDITNQVYIDTSGNASFAGTLVAPSGNIGGFTIGSTVLASSSLSAGTSTFNVGLTPDSGVSNISIWAGASIATGTIPTDAEVAAAPFRVTNTGALTATNATITGAINATSGEIGGFTIGADFLRSGADNTKLLLKHDATNPFISIKQATNGYANDGIFLGVDSSQPKFSMVTDSGSTYLKYNPAATYNLEIAGNAKLGPLYVGNTGNSFTSIYNSGGGLTYYSGQSAQLDADSEFVIFNFDDISLEVVGGQIELSSWNTAGTLEFLIEFYEKVNGSVDPTNVVIGSYTTNTLIAGSPPYIYPFDFYNESTVIKPKSCKISVSIAFAVTFVLPINNIILRTYQPSIQINQFNVNSFGNTTTNKLSVISQTKSRDGLIISPGVSGSFFYRLFLTTPSGGLTGNRTIIFPDAAGTIALNDAAQTFSAIKTFSAEPVFTAGAIFGSAADAANSIEITSSGNIIFEGSSADANETILTAANPTGDRTITIPDATGTIALMQSSTATMYIGRIWTRSYNNQTWTLRRDATLQVLPTDGTYQVFDLGYAIVDDSANADIIKVEIVGGTSSTSAGRAFVEVVAGTFQTTSGIAVLSYTAFDGVNGNIITPIQYLAQYRTNGNNFEVRRPTSIRMSGGA